MKRIYFLFAIVVFSLCVGAQEYTQKWNDLYQRTEFFDSYGRMIGYAKYNDLYKRLEYYDAYGNLIKTEQNNNLYNRTDVKDSYGNLYN